MWFLFDGLRSGGREKDNVKSPVLRRNSVKGEGRGGKGGGGREGRGEEQRNIQAHQTLHLPLDFVDVVVGIKRI